MKSGEKADDCVLSSFDYDSTIEKQIVHKKKDLSKFAIKHEL